MNCSGFSSLPNTITAVEVKMQLKVDYSCIIHVISSFKRDFFYLKKRNKNKDPNFQSYFFSLISAVFFSKQNKTINEPILSGEQM